MPAVLIGVAVIVVLLLAGRVRAGALRPPAPSDAIGRFADAIADAEGFGVAGAVPTRANNPGDLALGGNTIGAGITVFPTLEDGWNALYNQLVLIRDRRSSRYTPEMTIADMGARYAPGDAYTWASNVARGLGVPASTQIGSLL